MLVRCVAHEPHSMLQLLPNELLFEIFWHLQWWQQQQQQVEGMQ
jgi:hypothetical protein